MESFPHVELLTSRKSPVSFKAHLIRSGSPKTHRIHSPEDYAGAGDLGDHLRILATIKNAMQPSSFQSSRPVVRGKDGEEKLHVLESASWL